jgi:hypothetical protein
VSYISTNADVKNARFTGHVWRSESGAINGTVELGETAGSRSCFVSTTRTTPALSLPSASRLPMRWTGSRTGASRERVG